MIIGIVVAIFTSTAVMLGGFPASTFNLEEITLGVFSASAVVLAGLFGIAGVALTAPTLVRGDHHRIAAYVGAVLNAIAIGIGIALLPLLVR
jgi:hypothetical protein